MTEPKEFNVGVISEWPWQIKILQTNHDHSPEELKIMGCVRKIRAIEKSAYDDLKEKCDKLKNALEFYATYQPRFHPEGYYETNMQRGQGGEVKFGTVAREALKEFTS